MLVYQCVPTDTHMSAACQDHSLQILIFGGSDVTQILEFCSSFSF